MVTWPEMLPPDGIPVISEIAIPTTTATISATPAIAVRIFALSFALLFIELSLRIPLALAMGRSSVPPLVLCNQITLAAFQ